jgi:hypothetical protein
VTLIFDLSPAFRIRAVAGLGGTPPPVTVPLTTGNCYDAGTARCFRPCYGFGTNEMVEMNSALTIPALPHEVQAADPLLSPSPLWSLDVLVFPIHSLIAQRGLEFFCSSHH